MISDLITFIRDIFGDEGIIPLHAPVFSSLEKELLMDTIDSTFVSSVGNYVDEFEKQVKDFTSTDHAVATSSGTASLHSALYVLGIGRGILLLLRLLISSL